MTFLALNTPCKPQIDFRPLMFVLIMFSAQKIAKVKCNFFEIDAYMLIKIGTGIDLDRNMNCTGKYMYTI